MDEQKDGNEKRGMPGWRAFRWHASLLSILALECLAALVFHDSDDELRTALEKGTGQEQVEALFVLSNRDAPMEIDQEAIRSFLQSSNPLMREWIMTSNFARFGARSMKENYIRSLDDSKEAFRIRFLFEHQIGKRKAMKLSELSRFLEK